MTFSRWRHRLASDKVVAVSFRTLLLALFLGLILLSTGVMGWLGVSAMRDTVPDLIAGKTEVTLDAVTIQIEALFDPSDRLLHSLCTRMKEGAIKTSDPQTLARAMADVLQFENGIAWIGFGYPDGRMAGAWMDKDARGITISSPDDHVPREWRFDGTGGLVRVERPAFTGRFDARERIWFKMAIAEKGMIWTPPYDFLGVGRGISAAHSVFSPDGRFEGVFTVDFLLADMSSYLDELRHKFASDTLVLTTDGNVLAEPASLTAPDVVEEIQRILRNPGERSKIEVDRKRILREITSGGKRYLVGLRAAEIPGGLHFVSAVIMSRAATFGSVDRILWNSFLAACAALVVSLLAGFVLAGRIATPLNLITGQVSRIGNFELTPAKPPDSAISEVRVLSEAVVRMRSSLDAFSHYVPVDLVRDLVRSGGGAALGGERRELSLMLCDLADFTGYAEHLAPEVAFETLSIYFEAFGMAIDAEGGVIDKFLGDGVMALFNAPAKIPAHAAAACRAALVGSRALEGRTLPGSGKPFRVRVGLHSGEALVGNVGTSLRFAYTAIGDSVNLCSRLEGLNKVYGTGIIASKALKDAAGDGEFLWRFLDRVVVVGRRDPLDIFELLAGRAEATPLQLQLAELYPRALAACHRRAFKEAREIIGPVASDDAASARLLRRIDEFISTPVDEHWDGVFDSREK